MIFIFTILCICIATLIYLIPTHKTDTKQTNINQININQKKGMNRMAKIEIYTKSYCPYCVRAKELLKKKDVTFEEIDIEHNQELALTVMERSGGRKTVPQIFIDGKHIGGCDDLYALDSKNELDGLLH